MRERQSVLASEEEAIARITDGCTVGIGGFICVNKPMALIRALMRKRVRDLTVVAAPASLDVDLMIGLGMVRRLITPYVGAESLAPIAPFFAAWSSKLVVEEIDNGTLIAGLRAQIQSIPFMPVNVSGTSITSMNSLVHTIPHPFHSERTMAVVDPIKIDVALIHAAVADPFGNAQHRAAYFMDHLVAQAAREVVVEVEELVSNEEVRQNPGLTSIPGSMVNAVVVARYGAHPTAAQGCYGRDSEHISNYVEAAKAFCRGKEESFKEYLAHYVDGPKSHAEYCNVVGDSALQQLSLS